MKINENKFVATSYELFVDGDNDGELELMEKATSEQPMKFIFGVGMMLKKFEDNLYGLEEGQQYEFTIPVEEAYGEYLDENVLDLDRSIFEIDGKIDERIIFAGNVVPLMDSEGNRLNAQVVEVTNSHVKVDLNHPLAGENLHFKGSILEVRKSSEKELVELLGGGGGCGCGSGGCGSDDCGCESDEKDGGCGSGCGCH